MHCVQNGTLWPGTRQVVAHGACPLTFAEVEATKYLTRPRPAHVETSLKATEEQTHDATP